jgi:hypothetical protein
MILKYSREGQCSCESTKSFQKSFCVNAIENKSFGNVADLKYKETTATIPFTNKLREY